MKKYGKFFLIVSIVFLLTGCQVNKDNLVSLIKKTMKDAITSEVAEDVNMNSGLISYYLKSSIGHPESYECNEVFSIYGNLTVLNVDVASIVSRKYYQAANEVDIHQFHAFDNIVFEDDGAFTTATNIVRSYRYCLYELRENYYGILLQTSNLMMIATAPLGDVVNVSYEMIVLMRTIRVDEELVASKYSQKQLIQYQKESLDIFEKIYPESGTLQDMFNQEEE